MAESLILASSSPRRRELMGYTGIPFEVITADAEEMKDGDPAQLVMENARRKAQAVWDGHPGRVVLGADTIVYQHGQVLGKPRDHEDALRMLSQLSGAWHTVYTGVCVIDAAGNSDVRFDESRVQFVPLSPDAIARYAADGEPMDKAGAYALQGKGGMFVRRIEGSYSNVIGLPMALARDMLIYGIKKYIGSYAAAMGGVDIIVFTAGIGENNGELRQRVMEGMEFLGAKLDPEKNKGRGEMVISSDDSKVTVCVIPTNEEIMIARDTLDLVTVGKVRDN